ncbi:MAG: carboxypeptidase-like regulatory domain-containing protein [Pyrinomonadaceae bacterium]
MKRLLYLFALLSWLLLSAISSAAQGVEPVCHSLTAGNLTYIQNFDSLATAGPTGSTLPTGFGFAEVGSNMNTTYGVGSGTASTGDTFSFGTVSAPNDRSFGGLRSGSLTPTIGGCFTNNTGSNINSFSVTYDGEQFRLGATGRVDRLDFQYSTNATSILSGTWIDVNALDFTAPITILPLGQTDGNDASYRVAGINSTISSLTIPSGGTVYIRYLDLDAAGSDDGLAIDNLSLTAGLTPTAAHASISGRVTTADGRGIRNADIVLSGGSQRNFRVLTSTFGFYRFDDLRVGETYVLTVRAKRYAFAKPTRVISLDDEVSDADFTALQ